MDTVVVMVVVVAAAAAVVYADRRRVDWSVEKSSSANFVSSSSSRARARFGAWAVSCGAVCMCVRVVALE